MQYLLGIILFFFGAAIGSFILVIAERYNTGLSFWKGRSICFSCGAQLSQKDLLPVFSFLLLKGKCRYCQAKIPKGAFWAEIAMGFLSVLALWQSGLRFSDFSWLLAANYLLLTAIFAVLLLITIYDLRHFIIPDHFLVVFFIFSFCYALLVGSDFRLILADLFWGVALALPFLLLFLVSRGRWLGFGDVKYIFAIGFFLGPVQGLSAVILAFWIGAAFAIPALVLRHFLHRTNLPLLRDNFTIKSEIPFGPFLSLATVASFCFKLDLFQINELFNFW